MMVSTSINIFEPNKLDDSCTYTFTTADEANSNFLYDRTSITQVTSVASSDGTTEKFKVEFASPQNIDHVALLGHNMKTGNIMYLDAGGTEQNFTSAIALTTNTTIFNHAWTVTSVLAYGIVVNIVYTIDAGQKKIGQLLALETAMNLTAPNAIEPVLRIKKNLKEKVDGGIDKLVQGKKHGANMRFDNFNYADVANYFNLAGRGEPFYINLSPFSALQDKEFFRVQDYYLANMTNDAEPTIKKGHLNDASWDGVIEWMEV